MMKKHIVVASHNPVKIEAVKRGFERLFPDTEIAIEGVSVDSGVSDQPMSDEETRTGAHNRAANAREKIPNADFWFGVEGGIERHNDGMQSFAWIAACSDGQFGESRTTTFQLPPEVVKLVEEGLELGDADDKVFGKTNSKQENGAVGLLTHNAITRTLLYEQAVCLALIPFVRPELFPRK